MTDNRLRRVLLHGMSLDHLDPRNWLDWRMHGLDHLDPRRWAEWHTLGHGASYRERPLHGGAEKSPRA